MKKLFCFHQYKKRIYEDTVFYQDCFQECWRAKCIKCGKYKKDLIIIPAMSYWKTGMKPKDDFDGVYIKDGKQIKF